MIRGTTPTITLTFKNSLEFLSDYNITFAQEGNVIFIKKKNDISINKNIMSVTLTQEETLLFDQTKVIEYQVKAKTTENKIIASRKIIRMVYDILNEEIFE